MSEFATDTAFKYRCVLAEPIWQGLICLQFCIEQGFPMGRNKIILNCIFAPLICRVAWETNGSEVQILHSAFHCDGFNILWTRTVLRRRRIEFARRYQSAGLIIGRKRRKTDGKPFPRYLIHSGSTVRWKIVPDMYISLLKFNAIIIRLGSGPNCVVSDPLPGGRLATVDSWHNSSNIKDSSIHRSTVCKLLPLHRAMSVNKLWLNMHSKVMLVEMFTRAATTMPY